MSWSDEEYLLIKFQQTHTYDAFANPDKVGLGQCRCGQDMYWSGFHPHFAEELLKLGWVPAVCQTPVSDFRRMSTSESEVCGTPIEWGVPCRRCGRTTEGSRKK